MKKIILYVLSGIIFLGSVSVYATGGLPQTQNEMINPFGNNDAMRSPIESINTIESLVLVALKWLYTGVFIVAIIMILLAAFTFVTAGDDAKKAEKAKKQLKWAVVGIVVGLVATGIHWSVRSALLQGGYVDVFPPTTTPITYPTPESL